MSPRKSPQRGSPNEIPGIPQTGVFCGNSTETRIAGISRSIPISEFGVQFSAFGGKLSGYVRERGVKPTSCACVCVCVSVCVNEPFKSVFLQCQHPLVNMIKDVRRGSGYTIGSECERCLLLHFLVYLFPSSPLSLYLYSSLSLFFSRFLPLSLSLYIYIYLSLSPPFFLSLYLSFPPPLSLYIYMHIYIWRRPRSNVAILVKLGNPTRLSG